MPDSHFAKAVMMQADRVLRKVYLPRIERCVEDLSPEQIWWRPNPASNSIGNLVLHLTGNVRQWIVAGLGGFPDVRRRDQEFAEAGPLPTPELLRSFRDIVLHACRILRGLKTADLAKVHRIQGYRVTGFEASFHVAEHFSHHAGQIILITKSLTGRDLAFTRLPGEKKKRTRSLPAV
jgi:uncharacterized damage-inducible protein DinB